MDNTSSIVSKINQITKNKPIFYVTNDPERAIGLESILDNYHIVCIDHNDSVDILEKKGVKIFCLEKKLGKKNAIFRNSFKLLTHPEVQKYMDQFGKERFIQLFKPSHQIDLYASQNKLETINPLVELNYKFEHKFPQLEFLKKIGVKFPNSEILDVKSLDYSTLVNKYGNGFLIQFNRGHTGTGTRKIVKESDLADIKSSLPSTKVKVCKFIVGKTITFDAVATKKGTYVAGLSEQITGQRHLTQNVFSTVGNNFKTDYFINEAIINKVFEMAQLVGNAMYKEGFRGLFGLDLIVSTDDVYLIEINARQPASTSFVNKLLVKNNQTPISLFHLAEYLNVDTDIDPKEYSLSNLKSINAGQVILRNTNVKDITIHESVTNGIYRLQSDNSSYDWGKEGPTKKANVIYLDEDRDKPLVFINEACNVEHMEGAGILLTTVAEGRKVTPGSDVCRIQTLQSIVDEQGNLHPWIIEMILKLKDIYRINQNAN
ncbi:MAG: ATP-grasp domain-containing protein [bacterium]